MGRLQEKVIIVTGGATGIGRGISEMLAREGAKVVVANRNAEKGEEAVAAIRAAGGDALFVKTDVSKEEDCRNLIQQTVEKYGRLTGLVNNAGIFPRGHLEETTEEQWDQIFAINLKGVFFCCKHAIPEMRKVGGGSIVNIGSANAYVGLPELFAYSVSKGALITLTRNLANAHGPEQIRVNILNPGWVITETEVKVQAKEGHDESWLKSAAREMPLGRHQVPEDSAYACVYLLSDEANQVSGTEMHVDGRGNR